MVVVVVVVVVVVALYSVEQYLYFTRLALPAWRIINIDEMGQVDVFMCEQAIVKTWHLHVKIYEND